MRPAIGLPTFHAKVPAGPHRDKAADRLSSYVDLGSRRIALRIRPGEGGRV